MSEMITTNLHSVGIEGKQKESTIVNESRSICHKIAKIRGLIVGPLYFYANILKRGVDLRRSLVFG